jgi:hypothetical protein
MKKIKEWMLFNLALPAGIFVLKLLSMTFSFSELNGAGISPYQDKKRQYIYIFWHSILLAPVCFYRNMGIVSLVSMSKDGELATRVAQSFGFVIARGSSFRGAAKGLLELKKLAEEGRDITINTDGPRGPAESVGKGAVYLAKLTGLTIVPFGFAWGSRVRLTSWDRFQVPLPFSKGAFKFGTPVEVGPETLEEDSEIIRKKLEQELKVLNSDCEAHFGR